MCCENVQVHSVVSVSALFELWLLGIPVDEPIGLNPALVLHYVSLLILTIFMVEVSPCDVIMVIKEPGEVPFVTI